MAAEVAGLTSETEHLEDYLDELDYDLGNLEADYYEAWDDDDDEDYDDEDYCYCDECDEDDCALFHILFPEIYTSLTEKSGLRTTKSARKPGSILPVSESPIISAGFEVAQGTAPAKGMFLNSE